MEFDTYVEDRRGALMRFATVLTGQTWLADDLVSDVLGRAYEQWDRIDGLAEPHAYVRRMVVNEHLSFRRRWARTAPSPDVQLPHRATGGGIDDVAERDDMIARLDTLPRKQRTAVVLRYYVGLSDADIADHLGCHEVTVRSQISRALRSLRVDLGPSLTHSHLETR